FLSHLHFDHVKELPALADNLPGIANEPLTVGCIPAVLEGLKKNIFNGELYPNFFNLPHPEPLILQEKTLEPGKEVSWGRWRITPIMVNHSVPTAGVIVQDDQSAFLYSADTAETERIWAIAGRIPNLKAAFIECSFPNEMQALAGISKHLTPKLLDQEFRKIGIPDLPLYVYHLKPTYRDRILEQLADLPIPNLTVLEEGQMVEV
ncbi:MAG: MBL fold metallo-hydrolase, partial [Nitrospirales bacterium]|nr:MBL fold metallo-hydrolase [Nitrospirales bacterium]